MSRLRKLTISLLALVFALGSFAQKPAISLADSIAHAAKMQWFADAKLGIFIHWGIYSVDGTSESWAFHNKRMSHADYMSQINRFDASNYSPDAWVSLIKESGARYTVITSKHHDGVALWDTKQSRLSIPAASPAARDVLTPFVEAARAENLRVGLYYSLIDWTYPDYPGFLRDSSRYRISDEPKRWEAFTRFNHAQIDELMLAYKPDLMWFDGDWEHSAEEWQSSKIRKSILSTNPSCIINGRLNHLGDYSTPEQNFPVSRPSASHWELCMTMNDSWGYYPTDSNYKTPYEVISIFADVIGLGGNLLLDIGPRSDGMIPAEQVNILKTLGEWTSKHEEAIFGTVAGLPQGHFYGASTLSKDSMSLYLFLPGYQSGEIVLKGIKSKILKVKVLGYNNEAPHKIVGKISWSPVPGLVYIQMPRGCQDKYMTVLKVEFEEPLRLYRGQGGLF
jgi:alpha-L-fucosidase